jgi:N-formylglutamate deformylase
LTSLASTPFTVRPGSAAAGGDATPLLVSVPHAGTLVPAEDAPLLALEGKALLRDADLFCDRLVAGIARLGVTCVVQNISRYVLDVNRAPDDVDKDVCPDIERPAKPSARGLVWRQTTDGADVLRRPLTVAELRSRVERIHAPYHAELARLLEERRARFGAAILLDVHSMPSTGRPGHADPGARRADVVPGDVRGSSCAPLISKVVSEHFARLGYAVRPNDPYMGGYITRHHGRPARGTHAIQLELNRDLYMDEDALTFDEKKAARLVPHLEELVGRLRDTRL